MSGGCSSSLQPRPVGLQMLSALALRLRSSVSPNKRLKFVGAAPGEPPALACSCFRAVELLDPPEGAGQLLQETLRAQQEACGSGCGGLLLLAGSWGGAAVEAQRRGGGVAEISAAFSGGLEECERVSRVMAEPLDTLLKCSLVTRAAPLSACTAPPLSAPKPLLSESGSILLNSKRPEADSGPPHMSLEPHKHLHTRPPLVKLSRFLCAPPSSTNREGVRGADGGGRTPKPTLLGSVSHVVEHKPPPLRRGAPLAGCGSALQDPDPPPSELEASSFDSGLEGTPPLHLPPSLFLSGCCRMALAPPLLRLGGSLSHGCDSEMDLVLEAARLQAGATGGAVTFDPSQVLTCPLPGRGSGRGCCVVGGAVLQLPAERAALAPLLQGRPLRGVFIGGNLRGGCGEGGRVRRVGTVQQGGAGLAEGWEGVAAAALKRLGVSLLLLGGAAAGCGALLQLCRRQGVLVLERVPPLALAALSQGSGGAVLSGPLQLSPRCVGAGLRLELPFGEGGGAVRVTVGGAATGGALVTAVLTARIPALLQAVQDRFWGCARRVHRALTEGVLLPGGGRTELRCAQALRERAKEEQGGTPARRGEVLQLMANGLTELTEAVRENSGEGGGLGEAEEALLRDKQQQVMDCVGLKQQMWSRALDLVLLLLQTDAEVVFGAGEGAALGQDTMML